MTDDARTPEWRETAGNLPTSRHDAVGPAVGDARTALIARLDEPLEWLTEGGNGDIADLLREAIAALCTPAPDLRAWVQHKATCHKSPKHLHFAPGITFCEGETCTCGLDAALSAHEGKP